MPILVESFPGYRRITLNRPERLNALTVEMAAALNAALDEAEADKGCRALLLTGAGRGFCAGQDLAAIVDAAPADLGNLLEHYHPLILRLRALPIPVVCAVNGVAAGAGANLALACDIVLAARSASFVQAFARIGLIPDCGGTWFLPRLIGAARARALAMLAEPVEDDALMNEAQVLAARLASQASTALALTKRALDASGSNTLDRQLDLEGELQLEAGGSPDHAEGVRAFLDKRAPVFGQTRS